MRKLRLLTSSVVAGMAITAGVATVAAPVANAGAGREVYAEDFPYGDSLVAYQQCQTTGQDLQNRRRFDYFTCTNETDWPHWRLTGYRVVG
jgi:hypothetical protein